MSYTDVPVVMIEEGYQVRIGLNSSSATITYISANMLPNETSVQLPQIGDILFDDYPSLKLSSYDITYVGDTETCGNKYVLNYTSGDFSDVVSSTSDRQINPVTMEISGEYQTYFADYEEETNEEGANPVKTMKHLSIKKKEPIATFVIHRKVFNSDIADYLQHVIKRVGKINLSTFKGFTRGNVLFTGCELRQGTDRHTNRKWSVDLHFKANLLKADDSWQYQFNPKKLMYEIPTFSFGGAQVVGDDQTYMYNYASFDDLVTRWIDAPFMIEPLPTN